MSYIYVKGFLLKIELNFYFRFDYVIIGKIYKGAVSMGGKYTEAQKRLLQNIKKKILKWLALEYLRGKKQNIKP